MTVLAMCKLTATSFPSLSFSISFSLHISVYCSQLHTLFLSSSASHSTKTINLAPILSLAAACTSGPSWCCSFCHFLLFSTLPPSSCSLEFTYSCTCCAFYLKLISRIFPLGEMAQSYKTVFGLSISLCVNIT